MKFQPKIYHLLFICILFFVSCENEATQLNIPNAIETITANTSLSNLMLRTSANVTSNDDVLDNTSCFSVELPATVTIGNITITIENEDGLEELEELLESFENQIPEFVFPITIISADYTETVIQNQAQLEAIIDNCVEDDTIECVNFVYPISFSELNTQFVIINTVTVNSNEELYAYLEGLDDNDADLVALNFPVTLQFATGETLEVNSNIELSDAISSVGEDCEVDELENCNANQTIESLKECVWHLDDEFDDFDSLTATFNDDFTLEINGPDLNQPITGDWEITEDSNSDEVYLLISNLSALSEDLNGNWLIIECDEDELTIQKDDFVLELDKDCDDSSLDCSAENLAYDLTQCYWFGSSELLDDSENKFTFNDNGVVNVFLNNESVEIGTWIIDITSDDLNLILDLSDNYQILTGIWSVVECNDGFYNFVNENNQILMLEQECFDATNSFECFESFDAILEQCDANNDGTEVFNLPIAFDNCTPTADVVTYHNSLTDAETNLNVISNPEAYTSSNATETIYVRVEIDNQVEVFELLIKIEDCTNTFCDEADVIGTLMNCEWRITEFNGDDHLTGFLFNFADSNQFIVTNTETSETATGVWSTLTNDEGNIEVTFDGADAFNIEDIWGSWEIVECTGEQMIFHQGNNQMTFNIICE